MFTPKCSGKIDKKLTNIYLLQSGINPDQIKKSQSKSRIKTYVVDEQGENTKGNSEASFGIGLVGGFLIYIFIFMYGTMVMRSVIEEKTNRIVEIIYIHVEHFGTFWEFWETLGKLVFFGGGRGRQCNLLIMQEKRTQ